MPNKDAINISKDYESFRLYIEQALCKLFLFQEQQQPRKSWEHLYGNPQSLIRGHLVTIKVKASTYLFIPPWTSDKKTSWCEPPQGIGFAKTKQNLWNFFNPNQPDFWSLSVSMQFTIFILFLLSPHKKNVSRLEVRLILWGWAEVSEKLIATFEMKKNHQS